MNALENWDLDELKKLMASHADVSGWIFQKERTRRRERYFLLDKGNFAIDQDRDTLATEYTVQLFVKSTRSGFQGEIRTRLYPTLALKPQIEQAVSSAQKTEHKEWSLPLAPTGDLPKYKSADPRIAEDLEGALVKLSAEIQTAVIQKRPSVFNSAELFISIHEYDTTMSNGFQYSSARTKVYIEAAYSMSGKNEAGAVESNEYMNTKWSVGLDDVGVAEFFNDVAARAEVSTQVRTPESGTYAVLIDHESLSNVLDSYLGQVSAASVYHALPHLKVGDAFVPDAEGDLINLMLDPSTPFGASTTSIDMGVPQYPLELIKDNKVGALTCSKRYADYLGMPLSTTVGNWILGCGTRTKAELCKMAPKVIEILQFSALNADGNTGTFSSEIRLARLYDNTNNTVSYLKGGSLSGSIKDNFSKLRFSKEPATRCQFDSWSDGGLGYFGPAFALLNDVSVVG